MQAASKVESVLGHLVEQYESAGESFAPIHEGRQTFTLIGASTLSCGSIRMEFQDGAGRFGYYTAMDRSRGKTPESALAMQRMSREMLKAVFGSLQIKIGDVGVGTFEHRIDNKGRTWSNLVSA